MWLTWWVIIYRSILYKIHLNPQTNEGTKSECIAVIRRDATTLPETNMAPENRPSQKETGIPSIQYSGALLVSGSAVM